MRRILFAALLLGLLATAGGIAALYIFRDQLALRELRLRLAALDGAQVDVGSLRSTVLGAFSLELGEISVRQPHGASVRIARVVVSSPLGLPGLYSAWKARTEIPLEVKLAAVKANLPPAEPAAAKGGGPFPDSLPFTAGSPLPLHLTIVVDQGELAGPAPLGNLQAKLEARVRESGLEASVQTSFTVVAGEAPLPVTISGRLAASREAVKLSGLSIRAAGLEGSGSGELKLKPLQGSLKAAIEAPDLARVSLRAEDRAAIGLTGAPAGAVSLKTDTELAPGGKLTAVGVLHLQSLVLPLRAPERTALAAVARGHHVEGTVAARAEVPFRVSTDLGGKAPTALLVQNGAAELDLTRAEVASAGLIHKPAGVPLTLSAAFSRDQGGLELPAFALHFHTLTLSGSAKAPAPLGSRTDAAFKLKVASLAGFPELVPMLGAAGPKGASLDDARGSIEAEGRVRIDPAAPSRSLVDLRSLSVSSLRLPLNYASETAVARGVLTGSASGAGRYDAGDLAITRTAGSFDLTDLGLTLPGKFEKKRGRKLSVAFDAAGTPARLKLTKLALAADGIAASLSGSALFDAQRNATLDLRSSAKAELAALREYLPKLPVKISAGTFDAQAKVGGTWRPADGIEKSPLRVDGTLAAKLGTVVMPEPPKDAAAAAKAPPPAALLPPWPAARESRFAVRAEIQRFERGALVASGITAAGKLDHGVFSGSAVVAKVFGGKAALKDLAAKLTEPKLAVRGTAAVDGLDLSQAAGFVDPSYGKIIKGALKADAAFSVPDVWGEDLLGTAAASGKAHVRDGYLSTASFDSLVNEKLKGIPGVGDKAKVTTGGLSAEIHTAFKAAGGTATLPDFVATTPARDEMRLAGTMNLAFDCDLSGEAHLANAPVTGPIREANSDPQGRLVVPVRFHGNLKAPEASVATNAIQAMLAKTAAHEGEKLKARAIDEAKKKAQDELKNAAGGLLDQLKKGIKR